MSDYPPEMMKDALRYQKLRKMLRCADFLYLEADEVALIFVLPPGSQVSANLDATLDALQTP